MFLTYCAQGLIEGPHRNCQSQWLVVYMNFALHASCMRKAEFFRVFFPCNSSRRLLFCVRLSLPFLSLGICTIPKRFYSWWRASPLHCASYLLKATPVSLRMMCLPRIKLHHLKTSARSQWGTLEDTWPTYPAWDAEFFWVLSDCVLLNFSPWALLIPTGYLHSVPLGTILGLNITFMRSWLTAWAIAGWFPRIRSGR